MTTDLDRTTAILSIHGRHIDRIFTGAKNIEWRRQPLPQQVERVLMWRTATRLEDGCIVGSFEVDYQSTATVEDHLQAGQQEPDLRRAGLEDQALIEYAGGLDMYVTAIGIFTVEKFPRPTTLGLARGPQAFQYAPNDWLDYLEAAR